EHRIVDDDGGDAEDGLGPVRDLHGVDFHATPGYVLVLVGGSRLQREVGVVHPRHEVRGIEGHRDQVGAGGGDGLDTALLVASRGQTAGVSVLTPGGKADGHGGNAHACADVPIGPHGRFLRFVCSRPITNGPKVFNLKVRVV